MNSDTYEHRHPKKSRELRAHLNDPLFANAYFLMANTILNASAGFFFWIIAARFYSAEDVGLGSAMFSAAGFIGMLSIFGLDIARIRYLPEEKDKGGMINSCFTITVIAALSLSLMFLSGLNAFAPAFGILPEYNVFGLAFILFTITSSLSSLQANVFVAVES